MEQVVKFFGVGLRNLFRRQYLIWGIRLMLSGGLIWLLFHFISLEKLYVTLQHVQPGWFLAALVAGLAQIFVSAWRWQVILWLLDAETPSLLKLVYFYLVSNFFNNFAPANLMGDASRMNMLYQINHSKLTAAGSVVLERILNLVVLGILWVGVIILHPFPLLFDGNLFIWVSFGLGCIVMIIASVWIVRFSPPSIRRSSVGVSQMLQKVVSSPLKLIWIIFITLGLQFTMLMISYCNLRAVGVLLPLSINLAVHAVASVVLTLPISIQGVGVREGVYVGLLGLFGADKESVLAAMTLNYVVLIVYSIIGVVSFLTFGYRVKADSP